MDRKMVWFQKKRKVDVSVLLGLVKKHKLFLITLKHSFPGSFLSTDSRNIILFIGRCHLPCPLFQQQKIEMYKGFSKFIMEFF